jgi:hypothetical protein
MPRILVQPEELESVSQEVRRAAEELKATAARLTGAFHTLGWESHIRARAEDEVAAAANQCESLSGQAEALAGYLAGKARAFTEADGAGVPAIAGVSSGITLASGGASSFSPLPAVKRWAKMVENLGMRAVAPALPLFSGIPWFVHQWPDLFKPTQPVAPGLSAAAPAPESPPAPVAPPAEPEVSTGPITPEVPSFSQQDGEWADEQVIPGKWKDYGCLLTSIAMVMKYNDPSLTVDKSFMLNLKKSTCNGDDDVVWGQAEAYLDQHGLRLESTEPANEDELMQQALANLQKHPPEPAILGLSVGKTMHWLVITGYKGGGQAPKPEDFTINDPYTGHHWSTLDQFLNDNGYRNATIHPLYTVSKKTGGADR